MVPEGTRKDWGCLGWTMIKEVTRNRQWETTGFSGMNTRRGDPPRTEKELPEEQS